MSVASTLLLALHGTLLLLFGTASVHADEPLLSTAPRATEMTRAMRGDATLQDVDFVDERNGWAVGDRGAVWRTRDGGRRWEPQESGVACRLSCVEFVDADTGWAAGGWTDPVSHTSRAVLLTTHDGGNTWKSLPVPLLGEIIQLGMRNGRQGWAITRGSAVFPSGIVTTEDSGRGWSPIETPLAGSWQTGDLSNPQFGILAGERSRLAFVRRRGIKPSRTHLDTLRDVRRMKIIEEQNGILIGDGGLVMKTPDAGGSWQSITSLPQEASALFDWRTVATHDSHIWIAGQPGTHVLHSPDGGKSWQWQETRQPLPIHGLHFADERSGWAVGALGNILATRDGGHTWRPQKSEASRLAWLGIFTDADEVPLELVARIASGEGYYGGIVTVGRRDFDPPGVKSDLDHRGAEAARLVGAGENERLWQFPLRQKDLPMSAATIEASWNRLHEQGGLEELQEQLVRRIRTWRPTVIIAGSLREETDSVAALIRQALLNAVRMAADERSYPVQIHDLKLAAWKVPKVYTVSATDRSGRSGLTTTQFMPKLGKSLHGFAAAARGLLDESEQTPPVAYRFEPLIDDSRAGSLRDDLFAGRHLPPASEARRGTITAPAIPLVNLRRLADRRRALPSILAQAKQDRHAGNAWRSKILKTLDDLDRSVAAEILYQLATQYGQQGHGRLSTETFAMIGELYPENALASAARLRLVRHYVSGELRDSQTIQQPTAPLEQGGLRTAGGLIPRSRPVQQAGLLQTESSGQGKAAIRWAGELRGLDETLYADPRVQLPLAAAHRKSGETREAQRILLALTRSRPHDAWWKIAGRELALLSSETSDSPTAAPAALPEIASTAWTCRRAGEKPYLDGQLDEVVWQDPGEVSSGIKIQSPYGDDAAWPTVARLAYDSEYLYLAVRCQKAPGATYDKTDAPRQRDADLGRQDRVTLLLDVDRDYATYYELTIDARGWIADRIGDNTAWTLDWFVAVEQDEWSWTCEAAIRWTDLAKEAPSPGTVWAAGLQRVVPDVGFQSGSGPAAVHVRPEGFSHLKFE